MLFAVFKTDSPEIVFFAYIFIFSFKKQNNIELKNVCINPSKAPNYFLPFQNSWTPKLLFLCLGIYPSLKDHDSPFFID